MARRDYDKLVAAADRNVKERDFWLKKLAGGLVKTGFPYDFKNRRTGKDRKSGGMKIMDTAFSGELSSRLSALSKGSDVKLHMISTAALTVLLDKYTFNGNKDIIVGMPIYKQDDDIEFINTVLALRNRIEEDMTFKELLLQVRQNIVEADENQNYPLEILTGQLDMAYDPEAIGFPLFGAAILHENIHDKKYIEYIDYNMLFSLRTAGDPAAIEVALDYNPQLYRESTVKRIINHYIALMREVVFNIDTTLSEIDIVSPEEKRQILYEFNGTTVDYPKNKTLHQLFEEQAARAGDRVAVIGRMQGAGRTASVSYKELNKRVDKLAYLLEKKGVKPDTIVGVMVERSVEMIIGILGILKAGGAYLPIDLEYPEERKQYILKDSGAAVLLTTEKKEKGDRQIKHPSPCAQRLAYIIYTSGSTGKPKGVMVDHGNVIAYIHAFYREFEITANDIFLQQASASFDAFVEEVYPVLFRGGKIAIAPKEVIMDTGRLSSFLAKQNITLVSCSPLLLNEMNKMDHPGTIHTFINGGDVLKKEYISNLLKTGNSKVYNTYGPTETTVCVTYYKCTAADDLHPPIGKSIADYNAYILDAYDRLLPVGVPGQLCITGAGVTRGYLNNPKLTAEKFCLVRQKFCGGPGGGFSKEPPGRRRQYKSGDLARWLSDGNIEFLGRIDSQVKIRGYRIELGEIENRLLRHEEIKEAVVVVKGDGLCAYIVSNREIKEPRKYLAESLPGYMIPAYFVRLEKIPLTPGGKIDRKALPEPVITKDVEYTAPGSEMEKKLVEIWSEVLDVEKDVIGIDADFFEMGGYSWKATVFISRVHQELQVKLPLTEIFNTPTIRGLSRCIETAAADRYVSIEPVEKRDYYAVSSAQKRLYVLQQMEPDNITYNMRQVRPLALEPDKRGLEAAFKKLIARHESLRTSFRMVRDEPVQRIGDKVDFQIEDYDSGTGSFGRPFDLSKAPLLRVGLAKERQKIIIDMHHIITDGVSQGILTEELTAFYKGEGEELPPLRLQYKDYSQWHNGAAQETAVKEQEAYWANMFPDPEELPVLQLPIDYPRPAVQSFEGSNVRFVLTAAESRVLKDLAKETNATLFISILTVFYILLARLSGQEDIIVGTPVAARRHADLEGIIGMFVNTLTLRNYPSADKSANEFLQEIKERMLEAYENQEYQFEDLVEKLSLRRDIGRNPLFDVMFSLLMRDEYTGDPPEIKNRGPYKHRNSISKFDLTLTAVDLGERLFFILEYCTKLFKPTTIERIIAYFKKVISLIAAHPGCRISEIEIITEDEKQQILYEFNDTQREYPQEKKLHELFAEQVEKTPDNIAVIGNHEGHEGHEGVMFITYRELNKQSDNLACLLMEKGAAADTIVALTAEPSVGMIVSLLAILKSGGAYLPIDPAYPEERKQYMLTDSSASVLLATEGKEDRCMLLNSPPGRGAPQGRGGLAYIIYTSGTTGKPKGVMVPHRGAVNMLLCRKQAYVMTSQDVSLQLFSYTFDGFVTGFFTPVISGAKVVLLNKDALLDIKTISEAIVKNGVTHFISVPPLYREIIENIAKEDTVTLKTVTLAGDKLPLDLLKASRMKHQAVEIANEYGVTEVSVMSTIHRHQEREDRIAIGKPIWNTAVYILDEQRRLQPVGVPGEMYIAGPGLARGYLNNPELTIEKFLTAKTREGTRRINMSYMSHMSYIYKSGDLARWFSDGNIEFLGRIDSQVKIRGYRIELGEIENHLLRHQQIKAAVVLAGEKSEDERTVQRYLCAYIVLSGSADFPVARLREYLAQDLPDYMIPSYFVQLDGIPLTINGKIDLKALPEPSFGSSAADYEAPADEIEEKLVEIWQQVLGIERIGVNDNFFEIGGDSIKAVQISARLRKYGLKLAIKDLFLNPRIRQAGKHVGRSQRPTDRGTVTGEVELTPIQRWFFESNFSQNHHFNQAAVLYRGDGFAEEIVAKVFEKITQHHDALRMVYEFKGNTVIQKNRGLEGKGFNIEVVNLADKKDMDVEAEMEKQADRIQAGIDLTGGPLVHLGLFKTGRGDHLLVVIHHLVIDGVSWRILLEDFTVGYRQIMKGEAIQFQAKTDSFQQWARRLAAYAASSELAGEWDYWKGIEETAVLPPPADAKIPMEKRKVKNTAILGLFLDKEDTGKLLRDVHRAYSTEINDILLTALGLSIKEWCGSEKVLINLEGHGREGVVEGMDITRTVGWFTSQFPVLLDMGNSEDMAYIIKKIKEMLRQIPGKGIGYGILKYLTPADKKERLNVTFGPEPAISFNYLGQFGGGDSRDNDIFKMSEMKKGAVIGPELEKKNILDITGMVVKEGELIISFAYNIYEYEKKSIERLILACKANLKKIIQHCTKKEEKELTPSDLSYSGLSIDELDKLTDRIGNLENLE